MGLYLSGDPEADAFLDADPLALLVGMVLDQQIPLERAFAAPLELSRRLHLSEIGGDQQIPLERAFAAPLELSRRLGRPLDVSELAAHDPDGLVAVFSQVPALHRFPGSMAKRVQALCQLIVERYDGDAAAVWTSAADGRQLLRQVSALPGFGQQKAKIFIALLGKQLGVTPPGWREACDPFGEEGSLRSVADITSPETRIQVRDFKKAMKAAAKGEAS